jgi:nicotinate-nucleotide adenylyltransferase
MRDDMDDMDGQTEREAGGITPVPVPRGAERVVLFGGSFDPPTRAHARVGARARELGAGPGAWLVFVPAARSPFKGPAATDDRHRLAMVGLMAAGIERAGVWADEVERGGGGGPSYWVETLRRARSALPDARLWFVVGADQASSFHRWREPREILGMAQPIVVLREPIGSVERLLAELASTGFWSDADLAEWCGAVAEMTPIGGSATEVRGALGAGGQDAPAPEILLEPGVLGYIRDNGLYR